MRSQIINRTVVKKFVEELEVGEVFVADAVGTGETGIYVALHNDNEDSQIRAFRLDPDNPMTSYGSRSWCSPRCPIAGYKPVLTMIVEV
jgi:hypothetical protein